MCAEQISIRNMCPELGDGTRVELIFKKITQNIWKDTMLGVESKSGKCAFLDIMRTREEKQWSEREPDTFKEPHYVLRME